MVVAVPAAGVVVIWSSGGGGGSGSAANVERELFLLIAMSTLEALYELQTFVLTRRQAFFLFGCLSHSITSERR